ncbi:MAG: helicase [Proteobacteria bacterium]|nr:helicase [Pseudomonadota bacterium]
MSGGPRSIERYLTPRARHDIGAAIEEAGGNEVFFVGRPGPTGPIDEITVHCRGHKTAVPALMQVGRHGDVVIHNHPSGRLIPSEPDLALASHYGQEGIGFFIVDNTAQAVYVVVEPVREHIRPVEAAAVDSVFTSTGALPDLVQGYEPRPGQVDMAKQVADTLNKDRLLVVEAGTGTGKSLAYLAPAAMRSLANGERVAVATRTRHLQQQLLENEVPMLRKLYPDLQVAILKGRGNYLCRRKLGSRLDELSSNASPDAAEQRFLTDVRDWARITREGDLDDLPFVPDRDLWELVQSSTEHTLRVRCPHYDECFYYQSRRRAAKAHLLLANHHLLLADLSLRKDGVAGGLLPKYEHVVLDEAHHIEDVATDFAGRDVTGRGLMRHLGRIRPTKGRRKGLAIRLKEGLADEIDSSDEAMNLAEATDSLLMTVEGVRTSLRLHLEDICEAIMDAAGGTDDDGRRSWSMRLVDDLEQSRPGLFGLLSDRLRAMSDGLSQVARRVHQVGEEMKEMPDPFKHRYLQVGQDLRSVGRRLTDAAGSLGMMLQPDADSVRWAEVSRSRDGQLSPRLKLRPVDAASVVRELILDGPRSVTMTSATLSVAGSFGHFATRTGLDAEDLQHRLGTGQIASPFDYATQVFFAVPRDIPEPRDRQYHSAVVEAVSEAIRVADGRTFVLFTSYKMLHQVAGAVSRRLGRDYSLLRQGELPRDRLLDLFRRSQRAALFGTDSFWEGVDVRGEALSCVVIPKLPFRVPSEPIQQARAERIERLGGDAFRDLAVPQAVLKFRQGFGRLIRHRTDRGVVLVLDTRVLRKRYGQRFLDSLPPGVRTVSSPLHEVLQGMAEFLGS